MEVSLEQQIEEGEGKHRIARAPYIAGQCTPNQKRAWNRCWRVEDGTEMERDGAQHLEQGKAAWDLVWVQATRRSSRRQQRSALMVDWKRWRIGETATVDGKLERERQRRGMGCDGSQIKCDGTEILVCCEVGRRCACVSVVVVVP